MTVNEAMTQIEEVLGELHEEEFDDVALILEDLLETNRSQGFYEDPDGYIGGVFGDEY